MSISCSYLPVAVAAGDARTLSSAEPFPGAAYAPYSAPSYVWNPAGSSLIRQRINVPVLLVSNVTAADARRQADTIGVKVGVYELPRLDPTKMFR